MKSITRNTLIVSAAGITLASGIAGCAPAANQPASEGSTNSATSASTPGSYADGTYSADGTYTSPNGQEKIGVELTLASGTVTDLTLTSYPTNPNTQRFQSEFIAGIDAQVIGKSIDSLNVSKVSGSSLTSGGFNNAIAEIKKEAAQS